MLNLLMNINLGVSFLLELALLAIFGIFGYQLVSESSLLILKVFAGILAVVAIAILWGFLFAPKAANRLPMPWLLIGKILVFGGGVFMLVSLQRNGLAIGILIVVILNLALALWWNQL